MDLVFQLVRDPHCLSFAGKQLQNPENKDIFWNHGRYGWYPLLCYYPGRKIENGYKWKCGCNVHIAAGTLHS